jgi:hypothetical protein
MPIVWVVVLHVLLASSAFAEDFTGPVVSVLDGDTIEVLHNGNAKRIRLNAIDCPEKGQAFGKRAKQAARSGYPGLREGSHASNIRQGQVRAHHCRCGPAGWDQRPSRASQGRLVLVVSEICAIRYHAGEVGGRSEGSETWAVG